MPRFEGPKLHGAIDALKNRSAALAGISLHVGVAGTHGLVELGLGEGEGGVAKRFVFGGAGHQRWSCRSVFAFERQETLAYFVIRHAEQVSFCGVEVLRIARIGNPDGLAVA